MRIRRAFYEDVQGAKRRLLRSCKNPARLHARRPEPCALIDNGKPAAALKATDTRLAVHSRGRQLSSSWSELSNVFSSGPIFGSAARHSRKGVTSLTARALQPIVGNPLPRARVAVGRLPPDSLVGRLPLGVRLGVFGGNVSTGKLAICPP